MGRTDEKTGVSVLTNKTNIEGGAVKTYTELKKSEAKLQTDNQKLLAEIQALKDSHAKLQEELDSEKANSSMWKDRYETLESNKQEFVTIDLSALEAEIMQQRRELEALKL